jgi:hypothetical protein
MNKSNQHNANSLISILKFYGGDITSEQYKEVISEVDCLSVTEQEKFLDLSKCIK